MMALILGLLLPALAIILIDLMNNKVIDKKDIERATKAPILGFISHSAYDSEVPVVEKPGSTLAESFRSIRTSLKYFTPEDQPTVIAVTSTVSGEGKTFVAMNLAAIISMLGRKTLLVGLDLRKPRINKITQPRPLGGDEHLSQRQQQVRAGGTEDRDREPLVCLIRSYPAQSFRADRA